MRPVLREFPTQAADDLIDRQTAGARHDQREPTVAQGSGESIVVEIEMVEFDTKNQILPDGKIHATTDRPPAIGLGI